MVPRAPPRSIQLARNSREWKEMQITDEAALEAQT